MHLQYNPKKLADSIEKVVVKDKLRKYYRFRPGQWYGGIATSDCVGCNLKCIFCWGSKPRDNPEKIGKFYSPEHVFENLISCAKKFGYSQLRVSGNEPTIGKAHLLNLLELIEQTNYNFILETNGILIDKAYAHQLAEFKRLHVRVSLKGTNEQEFTRLTGAEPEGFELQLKALKNLVDANVDCHSAVMLSFSSKENFKKLLNRLEEIDKSLKDNVEEEYVFLYPHVIKQLRAANVKPIIAYSPSEIPSKLI
jgi:uncharacterized Fe-S cluster-containing radical SAM superfamily protein